MTKISFIIPTKDNIEDLIKCLRSLNDVIDSKNYEVEVIIVDDKSTKAVRDEIITNFVKFNVCKNLNVKTLFLSKNSGFIKALNAGIKCCLEEKKLPAYIGVLHDDVKVFANFIENLEKPFLTDISTWCASSMSTTLSDLHNVQSLNILELKDNPFNDSDMNAMIEAYLKEDRTFEADKIQSYATLFKTDAFKKLGLFNEDNLTSINIEYEFCKKIKDDKKTIKVVPSACVKHKARMSSEYENPNQLTYQKAKTVTEEIQSIQHSFDNVKKAYVVYTFIKDGEEMPSFTEYDPNIEYVCITSNNIFVNNAENYRPWKVIGINAFTDYLGFNKNSIEMKEFFKLNPHLFFNHFDISVWFDSSYSNLKNTVDLIKRMNKDNFVLCGDSNSYDCVYKYLLDLRKNGSITNEEFDNILQVFRWVKYPAHKGLADTSILVRKHNNEMCKNVMHRIWNFVQHTFNNDQLFFNLVMWRNRCNYLYIPIGIIQKAFAKGN